MRRILRLNVGMVIAQALYKDRERHREDFNLLRSGRDGVALDRSEKIATARRMLTRAGLSTAQAWLPAAVAIGLAKLVARRG